MPWKLPIPSKIKRIETKDKKEAASFKKAGFSQKRMKSGKFVLERKLPKWEYFQEKVRVFLDVLGFQDIECGQSARLGRYQIDVFGGYEGTFLVFECKSVNEPKRKTIRQIINDFAGKKAEIEQAIRERFGSKYNEVKFILALEEIDILEEDEKTARENDIYIWGSSYLKTGEDLFSLIGPLALHYVLKELGVSSKPIKDEEGGADYKVPSFRITVGDQQLYSFFLPAEKLLNLVYVFRLQPGNEDAYQRFISKKRILGTKDEIGITDFINNGGFFKNTVVCSFERQVHFEAKPTGLLLQSTNIEFGILSIPKLYGTVWVIDGQHRIYGYAGANPETKKSHIGIMAYQDIEKKRQAKDFIDINQKQKSVDPNTLWDLLSQTDPYSMQGAITKIARGLNKNGIFKNKILIPGKMFHGKKSLYPLKIANICNSLYDRRLLDYKGRDNLYKRTSDVADSNYYPDSVINYPVDVLNQYFSLLWDIADKTPEWRKGFIIQNNGFNIFLRVLAEVLKFQKGNWDKQVAKELMDEPLKLYFEEQFEKIKDIRISTSNEAGRAKVALEIIKHINQKQESFAREFIAETEKRERSAFEKLEPYQTLKELETSLRVFIEEKLKQLTPNWWKQRIPSDVQEKAEENMAKNESPWPWVPIEEKSPIFYINFPDYGKIIQRKDNWNDIFSKIFKDSNIIFSWLRELEDIRNKIAHFRPISVEESTTLRLNTSKIIKTIKPTEEKEE
ncbi:MAG: DGQHR domain-containing protein [Patescibacteria group bacterium]|jgi:DNA sulfur modification protein DndB